MSEEILIKSAQFPPIDSTQFSRLGILNGVITLFYKPKNGNYTYTYPLGFDGYLNLMGCFVIKTEPLVNSEMVFKMNIEKELFEASSILRKNTEWRIYDSMTEENGYKIYKSPVFIPVDYNRSGYVFCRPIDPALVNDDHKITSVEETEFESWWGEELSGFVLSSNSLEKFNVPLDNIYEIDNSLKRKEYSELLPIIKGFIQKGLYVNIDMIEQINGKTKFRFVRPTLFIKETPESIVITKLFERLQVDNNDDLVKKIAELLTKN